MMINICHHKRLLTIVLSSVIILGMLLGLTGSSVNTAFAQDEPPDGQTTPQPDLTPEDTTPPGEEPQPPAEDPTQEPDDQPTEELTQLPELTAEPDDLIQEPIDEISSEESIEPDQENIDDAFLDWEYEVDSTMDIFSVMTQADLSTINLQTQITPLGNGINRLSVSNGHEISHLRHLLYDDLDYSLGLIGGPAEVSMTLLANKSQPIQIMLEGNLTTGYGWEVLEASSDSKKVPTNIEQSYRGGFGTPELNTITLLPSSDGEVRLRLIYRQPFEKEAPTSRRLTVLISTPLNIINLSDPTSSNNEIIETDSVGESMDDVITIESLPSAWDWRSQGIVPNIRNQGACGSCWAFATVGVMESAYIKGGGSPTNLSEQYLVSCNKDGWNCTYGGFLAHKYHYDTLGYNQTTYGAVLESDKPYTATDGTCNVSYSHPLKLSIWRNMYNYTTDQIKSAIYTYGPITSYVLVGNAFENYSGGIFSTNETSGGAHLVILVGWNDVGGYWILRNSWGTGWGESGYMRIAYGTSLVGRIYLSWASTSVPSAPTDVGASNGKYTDHVRVSWDSVPIASDYNIYRSTTNSSSSAVKIYDAYPSTSYHDTSATPGVLYYYWIRACNVGCSAYSSSVSGWRALMPPIDLSASDDTFSGKVQVSWQSVSGASSYKVYRNTSNSSDSATEINTTTSTSYDDTSAAIGTTYYYWVKACCSLGCSTFSSQDTGYWALTPPTGVSASDGTYTDKIQVTWNSVLDAAYYQLYRNTRVNAEEALLVAENITETSYDDIDATPGTSYYYWVKACNDVICNDISCSRFSVSDKGYIETISNISSSAISDGWVLESARYSSKGGSLNRTAATLSVGDDSRNRQYRSILHFNTAALPDNAVITSVKLQVKRASYTGTNPFITHGALYVDLRKGAFSGNNALQLTDWQAPASKSIAGKIPAASASNWHTLNLAKANFSLINKLGMTQFRLRFFKQDNGDNGADTVNFYSGNAAAANRPKLIITYYVP